MLYCRDEASPNPTQQAKFYMGKLLSCACTWYYKYTHISSNERSSLLGAQPCSVPLRVGVWVDCVRGVGAGAELAVWYFWRIRILNFVRKIYMKYVSAPNMAAGRCGMNESSPSLA